MAIVLVVHPLCSALPQQTMKLTRAVQQIRPAEDPLKAIQSVQTQVGLYGKVSKGQRTPHIIPRL